MITTAINLCSCGSYLVPLRERTSLILTVSRRDLKSAQQKKSEAEAEKAVFPVCYPTYMVFLQLKTVVRGADFTGGFLKNKTVVG